MADKEQIAIEVFGHALRKCQTWRHGVRDVVKALAAVDTDAPWQCEVCGASVTKRVRDE